MNQQVDLRPRVSTTTRGWAPRQNGRSIFAAGTVIGDGSSTTIRYYLRAHPETAEEYAVLKRRLAAEYGSDRVGYTEAKTEFITRIESLALERGDD